MHSSSLTTGILSILSAGAVISAVVLAFKVSSSVGTVFVATTAVFVPAAIIVGLKIFPKTPIGKRVILTPEKQTDQERGIAGVCGDDYSKLLGKAGVTVTLLRPSGIAEIDGERYSVVAKGELIDQGVEIEVIEVEGNSIVVDNRDDYNR